MFYAGGPDWTIFVGSGYGGCHIDFEFATPTHIPLNLRIWHVNAYRDGSSARCSLELHYTAQSRGDGSPLPAFRISWTDAPEAPLEPELVPVAEITSFDSAGLTWQVYFLRWRDFDMWQARTRTPEGLLITSDIRIVELDKDDTLDELHLALDSMPIKQG